MKDAFPSPWMKRFSLQLMTALSLGLLTLSVQDSPGIPKTLKRGPALESKAFFKLQDKWGAFTLQNDILKSEHHVGYFQPRNFPRTGGPVVVFLHGGSYWPDDGISYGRGQVGIYQGYLRKIAEELGAVVILPGSQHGWTRYMSPVLLEINTQIRAELKTDRIYLAGHSMGAMGVGRIAPFLTDHYAGFLGFSGVVDAYTREREDMFRTFLNTSYQVSLGGALRKGPRGNRVHAESESLFEACDKKVSRMEEMREKYSILNHFTYVEHDGTHNPNLPFMVKELRRMFDRERDLRQAHLTGFLVYSGGSAGRARYFWLKALAFDGFEPGETENLIPIEAIRKGNEIEVSIPAPIYRRYVNRLPVQRLRVYLSSHEIDPAVPLIFRVNGHEVRKGLVSELRSDVDPKIEENDPYYELDSAVDLDLSQLVYRKFRTN